MSNEDVLTNYNAIGIDVIERMYSDGYLSIGGDESTREQARLGGIAAGHQVLDVGSGLGGPACLLAGEFGCNVTGLDLVELNVAAARKAANASGVSDATRFVQGDATAMDFADAEFDVVWGQDAWCHVDDKAALIAECARVLKHNGRMVFSDWVTLGQADVATAQAALDAAASPHMVAVERYVALLQDHGLVVESRQDLSALFTRQYQQVMAGLNDVSEQIVQRWGQKVFDIVAEKNGDILRGFEQRAIGGVRIVAHKTHSQR